MQVFPACASSPNPAFPKHKIPFHTYTVSSAFCAPSCLHACKIPLFFAFTKYILKCISAKAYLHNYFDFSGCLAKNSNYFCISRCGSLFLISASCHARFVFRTLSCASCALQSAFFSLRLFFEFFSPAMGFGSSLTAAGPHGILTRFPLSSPMLAVYAPKTLQSYDSITLQTQNPIGPQYLKTIKTA